MIGPDPDTGMIPGAAWRCAPGASLAARLIARLVGPRVIVGSIAITLPNGEGLALHGRDPGPGARVEIRRWSAFMRAAVSGSTGLAAAYVAGAWDSPDLPALVELAARNLDRGARAGEAGAATRPLRRLLHLLRPNSRRGSRRNIAFHYDIGNAFYAAWLDRSMSYSAGLFADARTTLEAAQAAKYRRLLDSLAARPGEHLLEIGCGWGALAEIAARDYGLCVTAITLSREQYDYARSRIAGAGLADRVEVRLQDYRDLEGRYDHIVSVEMMEAVGERFWPGYFAALARHLVPGGRIALQVITIDEGLFEHYRRSADFIQAEIFPGGMLPSPSAVRRESARAGLAVADDFAFGRHYARTLAEWRQRFGAHWDDIAALSFDDRFRRLWQFYLSYCEGGFRAGRIDVRQYLLEAPETARVG